MCSGRLSFAMCVCHEGCMRVDVWAGSLGSFLCFVTASCRRVALRMSTAVRSLILGLVLIPFGNLASIASVGWMWYMRVVVDVCFW